jgi:hypothetical protein
MPFALLMTDYLNRLEKGDPNAVRFHNKCVAFRQRIWNWITSWFR